MSAVLDEIGEVELAPEFLTDLIRSELVKIRLDIQQGATFDRDTVVDRCRSAIDALAATRFEPIINGTGIVLHTNLGRAPVSQATAQAMASAASSYLSLELDPETNLRGGRMDEIARLIRVLTGAEATLVVNNNAAAVLLTLAALCAGRDVIVSRGEAVEIGGGFRIPDVIAQSGCHLVEVGTTNRTYVTDFEHAAGPETAALLKVHASNFRVEGFTAGVSTAELGALANRIDLPLIEDLGSGALLDTVPFGLKHEPTIREAVEAGAGVITLSGDKLLGGPQAGIIAGRKELLQRIERHPLARAVRADKVALAGVAATLRHYITGNAAEEIPIWRMIAATTETLTARARTIAEPLGLQRFPEKVPEPQPVILNEVKNLSRGHPEHRPPYQAAPTTTTLDVVDSISSIGGGSLPGETLPSIAIRIATSQPDALAKSLRTGTPRVFPIIRDGAVLIDMRAIQPEQDSLLAAAIRSALE